MNVRLDRSLILIGRSSLRSEFILCLDPGDSALKSFLKVDYAVSAPLRRCAANVPIVVD